MPSFRQIPYERSSAASNRLTARCNSRILHSFSIVCWFVYGLFAAVPDAFAAFDTLLRVDDRKSESRLCDRPDGANRYQQGILIGYISTLTMDSNNLTKSGTITPAVDFEHIEEVLVILNKKQTAES